MSTTGSVVDFHLDGQGVRGVFWPVRREEMLAVREAAADIFLPLINQAEQDGLPGGAELRILALVWLAEVMGIFQAHALARRLPRDERFFGFAPDSRLWKPIADGGAPLAHPVYLTLAQGYPGRSLSDLLAKPGRLLRKLRGGGKETVPDTPEAPAAKPVVPLVLPPDRYPKIHTCHPSRAFFRDHVVATKRSDILTMHAAEQERKVGYLRHKYWFRPLSGGLDQAGPGTGSDLVAGCLDAARAAFKAGGESLPSHLESHLLSWTDQGCGLVAAHLSALAARPHRLPKRLWGGTGGYVWERILRLAVRRNGGHVTGHAHSLGSAYARLLLGSLNELYGCHQYCTYSRTQAEHERLNAPPEEIMGQALPEFIHVAASEEEQHRRITRFGPVERVNTVCFVGEPYDGEHGMVFPGVPDVVSVDWQARLLRQLKEWGYSVMFKEHPENPEPAPEEFETLLGAVRETRLFEQVMANADVVLFANQSTSTFNVTLKTDKPMVLVDFGYDDWVDGALDRLSRRCVLVKGWFDDKARPMVDWDELAQALRRAPALAGDTAFADYYF